ncbi:MAG: LysM peptidoglycan-binding domain-containing protein, partial [Ignavibacteria bacterium]|nr:LysM peptidoglycan-binding domain-containing protein [Ignavibacteria bacterium]
NYEVPYHLRIPHDSYKIFMKNYKKSDDFIKNGSNEPEFAGNENASYNTESVSVKSYTLPDYDPGDQKHAGLTENKKYLVYTYSGNEKLAHVADSFGVRVSDIKMWNNIAWNSNPKKNQVLGIYLTEKQYNKFYGIEEKKEEVKNEENVKNEEGTVVVRNDYGKKDGNSNTGEKNKNTGTDKKEKNGTDVKTPDSENKEKPVNTNGKKEQGNDKKTTEKKKPAGTKQMYTVQEGDYLGSIAEAYGVSVSDLREWNEIEGDKILSGQKLVIYSDKKPQDKKTGKSATIHVVDEGENLTGIAENYGVSVSEIKEWNELESDVIYAGQKLKIAEPKKNTTKESTTKKSTKHTVKEGENLTIIADKYGVTVSDLKEWNGLEDDVIVPGQVLSVNKQSGKEKSGNKTKAGEETKTKNKTHKVLKGETLASISSEYGISQKNLIKWNNLESDGTIYAGQVLKLYGDSGTKTTDKKTDTKKKRKRKSDYQ